MRSNRNQITFRDDVVLRYPLTAADLADLPAIALRHETARSHGLPVPEVLAVHEDHLELRRMPGTPFMTTTLDEAALTRLGGQLAVLAEALRQITSWPLVVTPWHELWSGLYAVSPTTENARALEVAEAITPTLTHGDLSGGNLLVTEDGDLTAVIDWDGATMGDPAQDFQALCVNGGPVVARALTAHTPEAQELMERADAYLATWPEQNRLWREGRHPYAS